MKTARLVLLCVGLLCTPIAHAAGWLATQLSYQPEGWGSGEVYGLNNLGQVIGILEPPGPTLPGVYETIPMAFVTGANGTNLHPIDPSYNPYPEYCHGCNPISVPSAINDSGQIAMSSFTPWASQLSVSLAGPDSKGIAPPPEAAAAFGVTLSINNRGQVAGTYYGPPVSFVTDTNGSNPHLLGMLDNNYDSNILGINDSGQLLVSGVLAGSTQTKTFVTNANGNSVAFEIADNDQALGLNNSAQIFGTYYATAGGDRRTFITGANGAGFTDIGSLGGNTFATAINNNGLLVGISDGKPFLYGYAGDGIVDLNQLISLRPGEFLTYAPDINDRGQIVAQSNLGNLYLLSPVPEPASDLMLLSGLALIIWRTRPHPMRFT